MRRTHVSYGAAAAGLMLGLVAGPAAADLVTIGAQQDNTLYEDDEGALSNGAGIGFFAGTNGAGFVRRGLIMFDIAGAVPAGASIVDVTLTLHVSQANLDPHEVSLHRLLADWGEGDSVAPGNGGGGAPAAPGDATWLHTFFDNQFWSTPGGDFDAQPSATTTVAGLGFHSWAASPGMIADVQGWLDNPGSNFGWALLGEEGLTSTAKRFDSREAVDPAARPMLTIHYTPIPAPGAAALFALLPMLRRRRRPSPRSREATEQEATSWNGTSVRQASRL